MFEENAEVLQCRKSHLYSIIALFLLASCVISKFFIYLYANKVTQIRKLELHKTKRDKNIFIHTIVPSLQGYYCVIIYNSQGNLIQQL